MEKYYILSNKYSTQERKTKLRGKVYDIRFNVYTMTGEQKTKQIRGFETKTLAKEGYLEFVKEYCEFVRHNPFAKKKAEKEIPLVGDLYTQYVSSRSNINKQSVLYDKTKLFDRFYSHFKDMRIDQITTEELYKWQDDIWTKKSEVTGNFFSYNYLDKVRSQLSAFLTWVEKRHGYKNNLVNVEKPKRRQPKTRMQFWTREEFEQFISVVDNPTLHALFTFMFFTGRRKGELFALFKTDIHGDSVTFDKSINRRYYGTGTWKIDTTKADKVCTLPVCPVVQAEIKNYTPQKEGKFYFGGEEPLAPTTVDRAFKKYVAKAGVKQIRLHDLRHSFVSMCIHEGASTFCIAELISDTVEQIHQTYGHLYESDMKNVLNKII